MQTPQQLELISNISWALSLASARDQLDTPGEFIWAYPKDANFHEVRSRSQSIFSSGNAIKDPDVIEFVKKQHITPCLQDCWTVNKFQDSWPAWIKSGTRYQLRNIDQYKYVGFSQGTQESFLNWYMMHQHKRMRVFRGDYWWHMEIWDRAGFNWKYIDDEPEIHKDDACIISFPFALSGEKHPQYDWLIEQCEQVGASVLVDFIYLPNSNNVVDVDLSADCIKEITFSLSKTFPVQTAKIAVRMTKSKPIDPMTMSNDENIGNRLSAGLAQKIIEHYPVDYMVNKYLNQQNYWCEKLGLTKTGVVHFGYGGNYTKVGREYELNYLSHYNEQQNRYNLGMLFENKNLLKKIGLCSVDDNY
jgi:hypothetical protein